MLSLLAKRNPCSMIRPFFTTLPNIHSFCSSSSDKTPNFMVNYLISSFGFSSDKAAKVSKTIAYVKSPEKPDSVRHFLKHKGGFTEDQIKTMITWRPQILCSSPENTLGPNLRALHGIGLSNSALTQIIMSDPDALHIQPGAPRIKFLKDFLGGSEAALVRACKNNRGLTGCDIAPKITLLQTRHGLSTHEAVRVVLNVPRFIISSVVLMEDFLTRTKELGFQPGLPMFVTGLQAVVACNSREALLKKMELLKSFGWSEEDFFSALRKCPTMVAISENNLQTKMNFLTKEARCDLPYIAHHPYLLIFSLEKRLRPRHHVLHYLESKGYSSKGQNFYESIRIPSDKFVGRFILPYKDDISGLHETYLAACA